MWGRAERVGLGLTNSPLSVVMISSAVGRAGVWVWAACGPYRLHMGPVHTVDPYRGHKPLSVSVWVPIGPPRMDLSPLRWV